jgi:surface polysaccharide O-acyltransferase-like enzyme
MAESTATANEQPPRRVAFDLGRLLAAYAIVWLHTPRSETLAGTTSLARFAVPFFVFAAVFFVFDSLRRHPERTFAHYFKSRLLRIYVPFLAWSGIYLLFKGAKSLLLPEQPNEYPGIELLWIGSFYHLWFMPFILVASLAAFLVAKMVLPWRRSGPIVAMLSFVAAVLLALAPLPMTPSEASREYTFLIFNAIPAVLMGISLAILSVPLGKLFEHHRAVLFGLLLFLGTSVAIFCLGRGRLLETFAGLGFMLVSLAPFQTTWAARFAKLGRLAYGIFLSHLLFIKVAEAVASKLRISAGWELDLGIFLFAALASTLLAWTLSQWSTTRWLVA